MAQTEIGQFNSYTSSGSAPSQPFSNTLLQGMEESIKVISGQLIQAIRPGVYTVDVTGNGTSVTQPSLMIQSSVNSGLSLISSAIGSLNSAYKYTWNVTLAQALAGAFFGSVGNSGTLFSFVDILKSQLTN